MPLLRFDAQPPLPFNALSSHTATGIFGSLLQITSLGEYLRRDRDGVIKLYSAFSLQH